MRIDGKAVGKELRALRIRYNKSVQEVCKYSGIERTSLYKYEKNADGMRYRTLVKMLELYNLTPAIFFKIIGEYFHNEEK